MLSIVTFYKNDPQNPPDQADLNLLGYEWSQFRTSGTYAITTYAFGSNSANGQSYSWRYKGSGSWEAAAFIDAEVIRANAIKSEQLQISKESGSNRIEMDGDNNCIKIYSNNVLRVKLGNLA
jgi:hypothetical protein